MNKDQVKGRTEEIAGKTKKVVGKVVHDESLKDKGRMEEAAGKARATYGDIKNDTQKESGQVTGRYSPWAPPGEVTGAPCRSLRPGESLKSSAHAMVLATSSQIAPLFIQGEVGHDLPQGADSAHRPLRA